ncbi:DUF1534 domain-containing protein [Pseudomonas syringae pv. tomato]|nr:DUF1534 domain-containing protein [Pseudomonas syringae]TES56607.1 DUF1534 domain-containing protein [Pseudomonas syringae pv. tomato]TES68879.1 DUF1534 domain-containing protein [Pseudomonas syringae pv. tomato]TES77373.1 DUF1534 domain-containing protein [Pseudomonas syringae pv. tomato]
MSPRAEALKTGRRAPRTAYPRGAWVRQAFWRSS